MNMEEYELRLLDEELGEMIDECRQAQKRVSKLMRFGAAEVMPGQVLDNSTRLRDEILDVLICVEFLTERGVIERIEREDLIQAYQERKAKIQSNLRRSQENGCVHP